MYLKGSPPRTEWSQIPQALTIVGIKDRSIMSLGVIIPGQSSSPDKIVARRLRDELRSLPMIRAENALMEMAWRYFTEHQRQTMGGLMIANYLESRDLSVQVLYSKLLMRMAREFFESLDISNLPEDFIRNAAGAMVINILGSRPPHEGNPIILTAKDR
jgi:hypothetical protein